MKKALFIGGTGTISAAISRQVTASGQWELYVLNRGNRNAALPAGVKVLNADIEDEQKVAALIRPLLFDCVCDFICFRPEQIERDYRLFRGKTKQFIFVSSASAYQKPLLNYLITESTPLKNPYWQYSRDKIACENFLMQKYQEEDFPITIVRPSHTYDERSVPVGVHGNKGSWQVLKRMIEGKPVIVHGDGTSLWTVTHNSDFALGFFGLMGNAHAIGEAFQITSDESLTWNQIHQCIANALGVEYKPFYVPSDFIAETGRFFDYRGGLIGDKANTVVFDNAKLKRVVPEFKAVVRFDQGVRRTLEYVLSHKECQKEDAEFDSWCDKVIAAMENARNSLMV